MQAIKLSPYHANPATPRLRRLSPIVTFLAGYCSLRLSSPGQPLDPGTSLRVPPGCAGDMARRFVAHLGCRRAGAGQEPAQIVDGQPAHPGIFATRRPSKPGLVRPVSPRGHRPAHLGEPSPFALTVGRQRTPEGLRVVGAALGQLTDPGVEPAAGRRPQRRPAASGACTPPAPRSCSSSTRPAGLAAAGPPLR
jgi:hypothetical protein